MNSSFIFIVGSFATTAPNLRSPTSDVDVLCSEDLDDETVKSAVLRYFPNLPKDVPFDISRRRVTPSGQVLFKTAYWQHEHFYSLIPSDVTLKFEKTPMSVPNALRDPNKDSFLYYAKNAKDLDFHKIGGLQKGIRHYGEEEFWKVVETLPDKDAIKELVGLSKNPLLYHCKMILSNRKLQ